MIACGMPRSRHVALAVDVCVIRVSIVVNNEQRFGDFVFRQRNEARAPLLLWATYPMDIDQFAMPRVEHGLGDALTLAKKGLLCWFIIESVPGV